MDPTPARKWRAREWKKSRQNSITCGRERESHKKGNRWMRERESESESEGEREREKEREHEQAQERPRKSKRYGKRAKASHKQQKGITYQRIYVEP
jgi:hypothetical protein